jgi:alkylation response protein AidB-like acyl-CoA dehydrogenase
MGYDKRSQWFMIQNIPVQGPLQNMSFSDQDLVTFAKDWSARLPERSLEIESGRRLPPDISRAFAAGGLFHALVPAELGGSEVHPSTLVEMIKQVSIGDGSAGWNVMIGATTGLLSASLSDEYAKKIYGSGPDVLSVGVTAPMGTAQSVEGGYKVTGRWPFGSGSQNAQWISGGSFIFDGDTQRLGKGGVPELQLMMFERDQVDIEDTWYVSGLRGTGSHHFSVTEQFVPDGRSVVLGGRTLIKRPLYQFPMLGLLALGVSSVSLGIGFKALEAFKQLAGTKTATGGVKSLAERAQVQSIVGESTADLESAEAYIHSVIGDAYEMASQGRRLPKEIKAGLRLAAVNATHRSVAAVDRLYQAGGGSSIYENSVLQRCFRDIHVTTQHIMVAAPIYEVVGRVQMGLDPRSLL